MKYLLDVIYITAALVYLPVMLYKRVKQGRYRTGWGERFGRVNRNFPDKECIWIHAVSVGEINATRTIVDELKRKLPDHEIVISTTTDTGQARAKRLYGDELRVFYFPLDFTLVMNKAFRRLKPSVCLLMELEVWPNFIFTAHQYNCPVVVVNGRISEHSYKGYKKLRIIVKKVFGKIDLVLAQTEEYKDRFVDIGCREDKIVVTGTLKYDTAEVTDKIEGSDELAEQLGLSDQKVLVAGGTGNDEEKIIVDVFKKLQEGDGFRDIRLVIVPRKPERFDEVAGLIEQSGFSLIRYSDFKNTDQMAKDKEAVVLGDTMGDLRKFYSLSTAAFVGRSLVPMGGSDMMEAAALGKCTIFGPYAFNFSQTVDVLLEGNGSIMVRNADDLLVKLREVFANPEKLERIGKNGQNIIIQNQGATTKTVEQIVNLIR